jgi:hypothetical protein
LPSVTDFLDEVSTQGVAGAADSVAVLKRIRGKADGLPQITGRDIEDASYALTFAADIGAWQLSDTPADEVALGDTRATILAYVRDSPRRPAEGDCRWHRPCLLHCGADSPAHGWRRPTPPPTRPAVTTYLSPLSLNRN